MGTLNDIKEFLEIDTYKNRIQELNTIIGDLTKENEQIKNLLSEYESERVIINKCICKYTPYMVSDVISNRFNIKISGRNIVKTAFENSLFEHDYFALRIARKKYTKGKFATTVIFSQLGILYLIEILIKKYSIDPNRDNNAFEKSIQEMKDGKLTYV